MPGARPYGFRPGDRAELLAEFILSSIAFTTRVARQEDVGIDLLCVLAKRQGNLLKAGGFFTVQVKQASQSFVYEKPHEIDWIKGQENPLFLCRVHQASLSVEIFSTWNMLNAFLKEAADKIVLEPGGPEASFARYRMEDGVQFIPLGRPILRIEAADATSDSKAELYGDILDAWVRIDRENVVRREAAMHWVVGPCEYQTNELPTGLGAASVFWNAKNLDKATVNCLRTAIELRLTLRNALGLQGEAGHAWVRSLDSLLLAHFDHLDSLAQQALQGIGVVPGREDQSAPKSPAGTDAG